MEFRHNARKGSDPLAGRARRFAGRPNMNDAGEQVVLVDLDDREIGDAPKLAAHRQGQLHRAISVSIVDPRGRMLLQRRARDKYHSGGLWTNACCTHPRGGETVQEAAERRLFEEPRGSLARCIGCCARIITRRSAT